MTNATMNSNQIPNYTPGPQPEKIRTYKDGGRWHAFVDTGNSGVMRLTLRGGTTKREAVENMLTAAGFGSGR